MNRTVSQSLFTETKAEGRSWQSYATSTGVHILVTAALLMITVPAIQHSAPTVEHVTLIAPVLQKWRPEIIPPPILQQKRIELTQAAVIPPPKLAVIPPPVSKPAEEPKLLAKAPEIKPLPVTAPPLPEVKLEPPAPPKPEVKTGLFAATEQARGPKIPQQVKTGGFGDPNGASPSPDARSGRLALAKLGSFEMPAGAGNGGGGGRALSGGVQTAGFGGPGDPNGVPRGTGTHGTVHTGGFGDGTVAQAAQVGSSHIGTPTTTPVEILYKPKPLYSSEARDLHLEGQVALSVIFAADGSVKVLGVMRGLGHGLDEAAQQAALQVRFKPATREGAPVDTNATIYITFQLT